MFIGFTSCIKLLPIHDLIFHIPLVSFNKLSSNNCNLKLFCTFSFAKTIIFLLVSVCFIYSLYSSDTPIALQVLPVPNP